MTVFLPFEHPTNNIGWPIPSFKNADKCHKAGETGSNIFSLCIIQAVGLYVVLVELDALEGVGINDVGEELEKEDAALLNFRI
jgi:hypothetical protein